MQMFWEEHSGCERITKRGEELPKAQRGTHCADSAVAREILVAAVEHGRRKGSQYYSTGSSTMLGYVPRHVMLSLIQSDLGSRFYTVR